MHPPPKFTVAHSAATSLVDWSNLGMAIFGVGLKVFRPAQQSCALTKKAEPLTLRQA